MIVVFADQAYTANIYNCKLISHACMHVQKGCYSAKTFLTVIPPLEIIIPAIRYTESVGTLRVW